MDGLQVVGELVGVIKPSEQELMAAAANGKGMPSWNVAVDYRGPDGHMRTVSAFFNAIDNTGQPTPLLGFLREAFGEPIQRDEDYRRTGVKVRLFVDSGIGQNRKTWYRLIDAEPAVAKPEAVKPRRTEAPEQLAG